MSEPVSILVPALGPCAHLERALASLDEALGARPPGDEVLVVDDSGVGALSAWVVERLPRARVLERASNGGFARALADGLESARHALVFSMNSDLVVRPGFLEPLIRALAEPDVFAAVPCVERSADPGGLEGRDALESLTRVELEHGLALFRQPCVELPHPRVPGRALDGPRPVPFALGGAFLARREDVARLGGFDALFEPFYMEDVDLGWRAWRAGLRCVHVPEARVEHAARGTIADRAPRDLVLDAIEKNQLLFQWKHLDDAALEEHLGTLERRALDAWLNEDRRALEPLALALEELQAALISRRAQPPCEATFAEIARRSDPFGD